MKTAIIFVLAYLLGSIPSGIWIGKFFFKKDIREFGSHSSGTTNTFRVLGKPAGFVVFAMDLLRAHSQHFFPLFFMWISIPYGLVW